MTREENIRAILECYFTGFKDVIIDSACERICELEQEPTAEKSVQDMTELEKALLHIKTRADAWAVKVVKDALEPCTDAVSREAVENITWEEPSYTDALNVLTEVRDKVRALPSVNPQPCEDAISREWLMRKATERFYTTNYFNHISAMIEEAPSVTQKLKTGHWIKKEDDTCWWYVCSECEQEPLKNRWNDDDVLSRFCPNCGAKMVEPQESEDKE